MTRSLVLILLGAAVGTLRFRPPGIVAVSVLRRRVPVSLTVALVAGWAVSLLEVDTGFAATVPYPVDIGIAIALAIVAAATAGHVVEHPPETGARLRTGVVTSPTRLAIGSLSHSDVAAGTIVAIALLIRLWNLPNLGYSHWDEAFFVGDGERLAAGLRSGWNSVGWYAPPGQSVALSFGFRVLGVYPWVTFGMSAIWGALTVLACYLFGRDVFSHREGLLAAAFCATSEFAVMYSRMALSDAMFGFFFIASLHLLWRALEGRGRWSVLGAGIATGILINTKYDGPVVLVVGPAYVALSWLNRLAFGPRLGWSGEARWLAERFARYVVVVVVAGIMTVPFILHVQHVAGLPAFWKQFGGYSVSSGGLIKTPISTLLLYFTSFGSTLLLVAALLGTAVAIARRAQGDLLILVATVAFAAVLQIYVPYPRLALPLIPLTALLAGSGIAWAVSRIPGRRPTQMALAAAAAAAVVLPQTAALPSLLTLNTLGYRDAAAFATTHPGATVLTHVQPVAYLYGDAGVPFDASQNTEQLLQRPGEVYLIADHTIYWSAETSDFMKANASSLSLVERISNPLPPEVLLQPAYPDRFPLLRKEPDINRYIYVYRLTGSPIFPPSWPAR